MITVHRFVPVDEHFGDLSLTYCPIEVYLSEVLERKVGVRLGAPTFSTQQVTDTVEKAKALRNPHFTVFDSAKERIFRVNYRRRVDLPDLTEIPQVCLEVTRSGFVPSDLVELPEWTRDDLSRVYQGLGNPTLREVYTSKDSDPAGKGGLVFLHLFSGVLFDGSVDEVLLDPHVVNNGYSGPFKDALPSEKPQGVLPDGKGVFGKVVHEPVRSFPYSPNQVIDEVVSNLLLPWVPKE